MTDRRSFEDVLDVADAFTKAHPRYPFIIAHMPFRDSDADRIEVIGFCIRSSEDELADMVTALVQNYEHDHPDSKAFDVVAERLERAKNQPPWERRTGRHRRNLATYLADKIQEDGHDVRFCERTNRWQLLSPRKFVALQAKEGESVHSFMWRCLAHIRTAERRWKWDRLRKGVV